MKARAAAAELMAVRAAVAVLMRARAAAAELIAARASTAERIAVLAATLPQRRAQRSGCSASKAVVQVAQTAEMETLAAFALCHLELSACQQPIERQDRMRP